MITKKLHSPFLFVCLSMILLTSGCRQERSGMRSKTEVIAVNRQLDVAAKENIPTLIRLDSATKAFDAAVKLDSAFLVYRAFNVKYPMLQQAFPNKAVAFLNAYKEYALQKKDTLNQAIAFFEIGKQYAKGRPDSAYFYFNASRLLCEARKDSMAVVEKFTNMAYLHYRYNDFSEFENMTTEGLKFLPKIPKTNLDSVYLAFAYNNYGLAYGSMYQEADAQLAYQKAYALNRDPAFRNAVLNNLALVHMSDSNYTGAIGILTKVLQSEALQTDQTLLATVTDNLGYSLFKTGNAQAYGHLQKAAGIREKNKDDFGAIASEVHLAEFYRKGNPVLFKAHAFRAYEKATALHSTNDRLAALRMLSEMPDRESRKYALLYISVKDSIDKVQQKAKNQFAKIKYDSRSANEENLKLKSQQAENKLQIEQQKSTVLLVILAAVIAVGLAIYIYIKSKAQKRKAVYETETRIAKQLHDELANDMHHTLALADSQDMGILQNKENLLLNLEKIYYRTRKISKENQDIDTGAAFPGLLREMIGDYQNAAVNVISTGIETIPWEQLSRDKKIAVHRIVQEWMVNMKKHSQSNIVVVKFEKDGRKAVISYKDNGVGIDENKKKLKGGLQNVENRIRAIKGTFTFERESGKGFHAVISFPI